MAEAAALDAADPLAFARARFQLPDGIIYLDGNSLGPLPLGAPEALARTARRQWGEDLIKSWNLHDWINWPAAIAAKLAPILGAEPGELVIADSTSVCLFKLLAAAARARPSRRTILTSSSNFPTDLYVAEGLCDMVGLQLKAVPAHQIADAIDSDTAVVSLTHVDYRSAEIVDMDRVNDAARQSGALNLWDLSHSAGALELELDRSGCDLAVGCGYKYLNGGPGAPAFIYVAQRLQEQLQPPLQGWMGHRRPFAFEQAYRPAAGIGRFLTGTPPILALAALDAGLETFAGVSMREVAAKSRKLSELFIEQIETCCGGRIRLASPADSARRASHLVFAHPQAYAVIQALIARGVIGDFREPDLVRLGFAPLYTRYGEVVRAARILGEILASGEWDQPRFHQRSKVT